VVQACVSQLKTGGDPGGNLEGITLSEISQTHKDKLHCLMSVSNRSMVNSWEHWLEQQLPEVRAQKTGRHWCQLQVFSYKLSKC
jgi:hypothetical protein